MAAERKPASSWRMAGRVLLTLVGLLVAAWLVHHLTTVIIMLVVAGLLAFILEPLVTRLSRHMPRALAIAVTYLGLISVLAVLMVLLVPEIIKQVTHLEQNLPAIQQRLAATTGQLTDWYGALPDVVKDQMVKFQKTAQEVGNGIIQTVVTALFGALGWLGKGVIMLVLSIYLLVDKRLIRDAFIKLVPARHRKDAISIAGEVLDVLRAYLRGQIVVIGFVAVAVTLGLVLLGIHYALTIGVVAGILEVIPYFGAVAGAVPAVILAVAFHGWKTAGFVILVFILINQLEGHVVIPFVMGRTLEMRPLVVLLSLLVGAELGGIVGLIVAVPVCRILQVLLGHGLRLYRESTDSAGDEGASAAPVTPSPAPAPPPPPEPAPPALEVPKNDEGPASAGPGPEEASGAV